MKKLLSVIACMLVLVLCLTACGQNAVSSTNGQSLVKGGVLVLRVNPEIAVEYDENGVVTGVTARNDDALAIINSCTGLIGQPTRDVVTDLVTAIGDAGYFVEEIEGERRQITLEIEPGSSLPSDTFLDDVIADIKNCVSSHDWTTPLVVDGESDFGLTDYVDTDYGPNSDGVTDYDDTDYGPNNDGVTDYDDTDYGPNNDGVTDYTDYGTTPIGIAPVHGTTDYDDTDYGPNNDGITGYTDYGTTPTGTVSVQGATDYDDTDYGPNNDGITDYDDPSTDYDDSNYA